MGACGQLIEIVREKPAKVFPTHTLFLADAGKNSLPNTVEPFHFAAFAKSSETTALPHSTGGRFSYSMIFRTISSAGSMSGRLVRLERASLK